MNDTVKEANIRLSFGDSRFISAIRSLLCIAPSLGLNGKIPNMMA
jgi:hypothetical protein